MNPRSFENKMDEESVFSDHPLDETEQEQQESDEQEESPDEGTMDGPSGTPDSE